jgi:hypothetical protein
MTGWTTTNPSRAAFIADPHSIDRHGTGVQIDWTNVSSAYEDADGHKVLPAGTVVGSLLGSGKVSPRVDSTNPAVGILETGAREGNTASPGGGMVGMLVAGNLYENLLPEAAGTPKVLSSDVKSELAAAGCRFYFQQYADTP